MPKPDLLTQTLFRKAFILISVIMLGFPAWAGSETAPVDNRAVLRQREVLLQAFATQGTGAIELLKAELDHETELIRRTAAHLLVRLGKPALAGIEKGLRNPDFQVRRIMMHGLAEMGRFPDYWHVVLQDTHPSIRREVQLYFMTEYPLPEGDAMDAIIGRLAGDYPGAEAHIRQHVVETVAGLAPLTEQGRKLLVLASSDVDDTIRQTAFQATREHLTLEWPEGPTLLQAAETDTVEAIQNIGFDIRTSLLLVQAFQLPADGWRFRTDPDDAGRDAGWYQTDAYDGDWREDGLIETAWARFLDEQYLGIGWYRRLLDIPEVDGWNSVLIHFGGVDEQGWVWLDGQFIGEHDMGPSGWDVPFAFDITEKIKPGQQQQITIRARNSAGNGGIWQPVRILFLREWPQG